jgi:hypothetical protein
VGFDPLKTMFVLSEQIWGPRFSIAIYPAQDVIISIQE